MAVGDKYESIAHLTPGIGRYFYDHTETGSFLRAVLENDLEQACALADPMTRFLLWDVMHYLVNEVDRRCWGSPEKVKAWLDERDTQKAGS